MTADPLDLYLGGRLSPEVTVARLLFAGWSPDEINARLEGRPGPRADALRDLLVARREDLCALGTMLVAISHDGAASVDAIRSVFDGAVARAPEASVAAYSLNDPAILAAATAELLAWLDRERLLRAGSDVLDLGCGIGRVAVAVAPRVRSVLGLDVSPAMVAEARRRNTAPNVRFAVGDGAGLGFLPDASFDLVLAVDSLPYLLQGGVAEPHMRDIARVLRAPGALAVLNLSYRDDLRRDCSDAARWAAEHGLTVDVDGVAPFTLWDARAFVLRKP